MDTTPSDELSWDNLIYIADFMELSGERKIALLGGEPSLHPHFVDFTSYLLERNFHVNVFTSGIMSKDKLAEAKRFLGKYPIENLTFTCNMNHPDISSPIERERVEDFLTAFGHLTSLGFNIYQTGFDLKFLIEYINKFKLGRHIRFGLAHPIPGETNKSIPVDKLKEMAVKFVSHLELFEENKVSPGFDCGMPMCVFTDEELGRIFKLNRGMVSFGCGPAIDIGPDMMVWSCFPLSGIQKRSLYEFNSLQEIGSFYRELHMKIRKKAGGIFKDCEGCVHRANDVCKGGCIAHSLGDRKEEAEISMNEINT